MARWPLYYRERLWLGNVKNGFIGIATLWTPKEKIIWALDKKSKEKVAVIGQLYTKRGIEFIFRNIWANPKIRYLIITGNDQVGSADPLLKARGQSDEIKSFLETVPDKFIDIFSKNVEIIDYRNRSMAELKKLINSLVSKPAFAKKGKLFPEIKPKGIDFPSENSVFRVEAKTIGEAWLQILNLIIKFGRRVPRGLVYGGYERTLLNLAAVITGENIKKPKLRPFLGFTKDRLRDYFKNFFSVDRGKEPYSYGERLFSYQTEKKAVDQVAMMVKKLKKFPYNKGAMAVLWQPQIDNFPIRQPWRTPCLTLVQGFCLDNKFHLTAYFRSNDMFTAWPQNAFALKKLQTEIAERIGKKPGDLTIISHCAHIDEGDLSGAQKIIEKNQQLFCQIDPRGSLIIEVRKKEIIVQHLSLDGKILAEYRQDGKVKKAALKMVQKLLSGNVISRIDHALDIGEQLGRAEDAVKLGLKFEQDKELKNG